jgi:RNA polymerase sigma-70 factor (ECF subfamily)
MRERTRARESDEAELVRRASRGDRAAFERLVRAHFAGVYALLFRLIGNHEDAEDLAQECFVRAWRSLRERKEPSSFSAWMRTVALHAARDYHRVRVRRGAAREIEPELARDRRRGPSDELHGRELNDTLRAALDRLPLRLRTTLFLRVLDGLEYDEVGRAVGVKPATARARVMQARKLLLRWLGPLLDGGAP